MELNSNYVNSDLIKAKAAKSYENINTSKLENKALRDVTDDFESFFMQQILDISLKDSSFAGKGTGSEIIKGMYTQALSSQSAGTMGISDMLYNFLSQNSKN